MAWLSLGSLCAVGQALICSVQSAGPLRGLASWHQCKGAVFYYKYVIEQIALYP